jgi:hypothetical protein
LLPAKESDVATLTIRFRGGDERTGTLHDAMDLRELARNFAKGSGSGELGFGVVSEEEGAGTNDFGFVGLRLDDVVFWHIEGLLDVAADAALFAELQSLENKE